MGAHLGLGARRDRDPPTGLLGQLWGLEGLILVGNYEVPVLATRLWGPLSLPCGAWERGKGRCRFVVPVSVWGDEHVWERVAMVTVVNATELCTRLKWQMLCCMCMYFCHTKRKRKTLSRSWGRKKA